MNKDKVYLKGYVIGRAVDTLGYEGLMVQLENLDVVKIDKNLVHRDINGPQKVTVPQFVADWIEYCKTNGIALGYALYCSGQASDKKAYDWIVESLENQETFARAWIDGYIVKEEKRYRVKVKGVIEYAECLKYGEGCRGWIFGMDNNFGNTRNAHTKNQIEEAGFGWVFDCPGIEIEEVKG